MWRGKNVPYLCRKGMMRQRKAKDGVTCKLRTRGIQTGRRAAVGRGGAMEEVQGMEANKQEKQAVGGRRGRDAG